MNIKIIKNTENHSSFEQPETLIEFPCLFPIKVAGVNNMNFIPEIHQAIRSLLPDFDAGPTEIKLSSKGQYISLTVYVWVENKVILDAVYAMLVKQKDVRYVL